MALPITLPITFGTLNSPVAMSYLDQNFNVLVSAVNGIGDGTNPLNNVTINGAIINPLTATNVIASNVVINSGVATLSTLTVSNATVTSLTTVNANITSLTAANATISTLAATNANISTLTSSNANIASLTAANATITSSNLMRQNLDNFLPNCQWQLTTVGTGTWSGGGIPSITKYNFQGTGTQAPINCTGFDTASNTPTFYTTDTQQVKVGDIVVIESGGFLWDYPGVGQINVPTGVRVTNLVANTSITVQAPFNGKTPGTSFACTARPICGGILAASSNGQCADGWVKDPSVTYWVDDFSVNACPGALRVLGINTSVSSPSFISYNVPPKQLKRFAGRTVSFGALVRQKAQGGSGTWRMYIYDTVNGFRYSSNGTGASYTNASYNNFEFNSVTAAIDLNTTRIEIGIQFNGNAGDVYYVALPTGVFNDIITVDNLGQNTVDLMRTVGHWNPPLLTPFYIHFPATEIIPGSGLYGYDNIDLEAISLCAVHNSVPMVKCKIEFTTNTVNATLLTGTKVDYSYIFGPQQYTQVAGVTCAGQGWLPLSDQGTFSMVTGNSGLVPSTITYDFDIVQLNMPMSAN